MTLKPMPRLKHAVRHQDQPDTAFSDRRGSAGAATRPAARVPLLNWAVGRARSFAPNLERDVILEQLSEALQRREERRCLQEARAGRDVCWPSGAEESGALVTVRIATYNRGRGILRTLESVVNQTYRNLEIIVIGDSCDEATADAVLSVEDSRIRFVNLPTRGMYPPESRARARWMVAGTHPMNAGLVLASGAWLAPCDDDDLMTPHHVEHLLEHALTHRLELVWSRAHLVDQDTVTGSEFRHGEISHGSVLYSSGLRFFRHSNTSWKRYEPGDWNLWRRMKAAGVRIGWLDELTYIHY
jgi:hypothetical protein